MDQFIYISNSYYNLFFWSNTIALCEEQTVEVHLDCFCEPDSLKRSWTCQWKLWWIWLDSSHKAIEWLQKTYMHNSYELLLGYFCAFCVIFEAWMLWSPCFVIAWKNFLFLCQFENRTVMFGWSFPFIFQVVHIPGSTVLKPLNHGPLITLKIRWK